MNADYVGSWYTSPREGEVLQYADSWIASAHGRALSLSLPFTPGNLPHRGEAVRAYFENLLPDSKEIRQRVARRYQTGSTDAFDLLMQVGRDCVGALQLLPDGMHPEAVNAVQATPLNEAEVARLLRDTLNPGPLAGAGAHAQDLRISIAGAQEKTALLRFQGQWCRPQGATPTTHIFKLPMGLVGNMKLDLSESVENEWLCAEILRAYGLPVAECEPLQFEDIKVLSVTRFDRAWVARDEQKPWLVRLPQEDFCQITAAPPHLKYEADGGPGVDRIMRLLNTSLYSERDKRIFFQSQMIFWMLWAPDGHAKNFSVFLRPGGGYELTPLYDILSVLPFLGEGKGKLSPFRVKMAMAVRSKNAHYLMRTIERRHWLSVGERYGVVTPDGLGAQAVVDDIVARTPAVVRAVRAKMPASFPEPLADSILQGLIASADKLAG